MKGAVSQMQNDVTIEVRWGECDPFHIVFYPNFFTWFDHCTWKLFDAAGLTPEATYRDYGFIGMPLVDAQSKFIAPARGGDTLTIRSRVSHWGRTSFKVSHAVMKDGAVIAEGVETRVWAIAHPDDPKRPKAAPIPKPVIERMGGTPA
jgi:4-hydroxybenzoyl-CoA thioesterase